MSNRTCHASLRGVLRTCGVPFPLTAVPVVVIAFAGCAMLPLHASASAAPASVSVIDADEANAGQDSAAPPAEPTSPEPPPQAAGDDARGSGRRDRGARGAMPLPPDWPRAGGFGTRERGLIEGLVTGEMAGADLSRREITDAELARAIALARRVSDDWGRTLAARAEQDPAQMKAALRTTGRRLFGLLLLEERAPKLFELKIAELRAQGETARAAEELKRAQGEGVGGEGGGGEGGGGAPAGANADRIAALGAALDAAISRQILATMAVRREELVAIEARIAEMRRDIDRDAADSAELAGEIRSRVLAPRQPEPRGDEARGETRGEPGVEGDRRGGRDERRGPREGAGAPREPGANPPDAPDRNP